MNTTFGTHSSEHSWHLASRRNSIESILSIQGKETDFVRDTSDSESGEHEYEPVSESDHDGPVDQESSGESDIITTKVIEVTVRDDGDLVFADSEQTDSDGSDIDSEMDWYDFWKCAQCQADNNNPLYRYCEKCFKVRKNFFPPRPKRKSKSKTRHEPDSKPLHVEVHKLTEHTDSGVDSAFASQELSQTSLPTHECDTLSQTNNDKPVKLSNNVSEPSNSLNNVIVKPKSLKRRAESVDRHRKRARVDSDSDSGSEGPPKRYRKSKSLDKEVAPLTKTVSDPAITIDQLVSVAAEGAKDNLCIMCVSEPKSGVFVHGRMAHICCCYKCALKVWAKTKRCPICNCKVSNVLKAVVT